MHSKRRIPIVIASATMLLIVLLLFCGTGGVAINQGVIEPPVLNLTINGVGVIAKLTDVPSCPVWFISCGQVKPLANNEFNYAIWIVWRPARSPAESPGARRLFAMRLVR